MEAQVIKHKGIDLTGSGYEKTSKLDPSVNDGTILLLDAIRSTSKPSSVATGSLWKDISGNGFDATISNDNAKITLDDGIKFADDNGGDDLVITGLLDELLDRDFLIAVMFKRTNNPSANSVAVGSSDGSSGSSSSFGVGFQTSNGNQQTFVRDSAGSLVFVETQFVEGLAYNEVVLLGLYVQKVGADTLFRAYRINDDFALAIDGESTVSSVQGIYDSSLEVRIGGGGSLHNFRGYQYRIIVEDPSLSENSPAEIMQREWDNNRSRFS